MIDEVDLLNYGEVACTCARDVRGCTTDDQYQALLARIVEALASVADAERKAAAVLEGFR